MLRDPDESESRAQTQGILAAWACFAVVLAGLLLHSIVEDVTYGVVAMRSGDGTGHLGLSARPDIAQRDERKAWSAEVRQMILDLRPFTVARESWPICQDSPANCEPDLMR